jgi:hypothetical protein
MRIDLAATVVLAVALTLSGPPVSSAGGGTSIDVFGTVLRVTDGERTVEGTALVGAVLTLGVGGDAVRARIASVEVDATDPAGEILLYDLRIMAADGSETPLCRPDASGRPLGFPLAGRTDATGALVPTDDGAFEFVCASGAQGKCVRFGYAPWRTLSDGSSMRPLYDTCVRMVRADYCGDGRSFTRDGTVIGYRDSAGLATLTAEDIATESLAFEAVWGPEGAICLARPRLDDVDSIDSIAASCPALASRAGAAACGPDAPGGVLVNYSRPAATRAAHPSADD